MRADADRLRWASARSREILAEEGPGSLVRRGTRFVRYRVPGLGGPKGAARLAYTPLTPDQARDWPVSLVLHGIRDLPQCFRYRLLQKLEAADAVGIPALLSEPTNMPDAMARLQLARVLVLYRVPWSEPLVALVADARRLGVPVVYELDDLVHRQELVAANPNLATVPGPLRVAVERGAASYLRALRLADHALASTVPLAADMAREVPGRTWVIENGIDLDMRRIMEGIAVDRAAGRLRDATDGRVVVAYGSGSRAHDADLAVAADGLARLMRQDPRVHLALVGPVAVPDALAGLGDRVSRHTELPFPEYLRLLAQADITVAPLLAAPFNEHKSQVKYLEAGLAGVPLVASPAVYSRYVQPDRTAVLASTTDEWFEALRRLADDPGARARLAGAAREHVAQWHVERSPAEQLRTFLAEVI
jgi:glycosyltransferase involved in cell wall biosynthesis